jgi:hypothetical protein
VLQPHPDQHQQTPLAGGGHSGTGGTVSRESGQRLDSDAVHIDNIYLHHDGSHNPGVVGVAPWVSRALVGNGVEVIITLGVLGVAIVGAILVIRRKPR